MVNISTFLLLCVCEKGFRELKESLFDGSISCANITKGKKPDLHAVQVKVWSVSLTYFMSALKNCSLYLPSKTTFFLIVIMWFIHSIYKFEKSSLSGELCLATKAQKNFKTANVQ